MIIQPERRVATHPPSYYGLQKYQPTYFDTFHDAKGHYSIGKSPRIKYEKINKEPIKAEELERPSCGYVQTLENSPRFSFARPKSRPVRPKSAFDVDRWPYVNNSSPGPEHNHFEDWTKPKAGHNKYGTMGVATKDDINLMYFK